MTDELEGEVKWSKAVKTIYAMIVGTVVILAALQTIPHLLEDGDLTVVESLFAGGLVVGGFVASMPWIFMPVLSMILEFLKKNGSKKS